MKIFLLDETQLPLSKGLGTCPQMRGPRLSYLYKLLDHYLHKGAGEFINSKIRNATNARSVVFCHRCCRTFVPGVNCSSRLDGKGFLLQCMCGCKTAIQR